VRDPVTSLPGAAARAEYILLAEGETAFVAASQPVGHDDLSAQAIMQAKFKTTILHGSADCTSCRCHRGQGSISFPLHPRADRP